MDVIMEESEESHQNEEATDNEERDNDSMGIISRSSSVSDSIANLEGEIQEATEAPNSDRIESDQDDVHVSEAVFSHSTPQGVAAAIRAPEDSSSITYVEGENMHLSSPACARRDMGIKLKLKASLRATARQAGVGAFHVIPPAELEPAEETKEEDEETGIWSDHTIDVGTGTISTTSDGDDDLIYNVVATPVIDQDMILATPVTVKKVQNKKKKIGATILIFISCIIIAIIITTARKRSGSILDTSLTSSPTLSPTVNSDELQSQLGAFSTVEDLERIGSPQRNAMLWIANRDVSGIEIVDPLFYQRYALLVLYYATQPDAFTSLDVWVDTTKHECDWGRELSCITDSTGMRRLTNFDLSKKRLQGTIPTEIGLLKDLEELNLSENELGGTIPEEIGKLTLLMRLDISKNNLSGIIPDTIGSIEGLNYLILRHNRLTGPYPDAVHTLFALKALDLSTNQLIGTLSYVPNTLLFLVMFNIRDNNFSGTIPSSLWSLAELSIIDLSFNNLSGNFLDLDYKSFVRLEEVTISHNRFTGSLPNPELSQIDLLIRLKKIDISHNFLSGYLPPLGYIPSIKYLDFSSNKFSGTIPFVAYMDILEVFQISDNLLTGKLPQFPVKIKHLDIKGNALTGGVFDSRLLKLQSLEVLSIGNSSHAGSIPSEIANLSLLRYFDASNCDLSGTLPHELSNLQLLSQLHLDGNKLTGPLPSEFGKLDMLKVLYLHDNMLTSTIPAELRSMSSLTVLSLGDNDLSGSIPTEISELLDLVELNLSGNVLEGMVPKEVCALAVLKQLQVDSSVQCSCCSQNN